MARKTRLSESVAIIVPRFTIENLLDDGVIEPDWVHKPDAPAGAPEYEQKGLSIGYSILGAAAYLKVSRQRVYQLIKAGRLEAFELVDDAKYPAGVFVKARSLSEFKYSDRKPGPKAKEAERVVESKRTKKARGKRGNR